MKFKEAYNLYIQDVNIRVPVCNEHRENLFEMYTDLLEHPEVDRTRLRYYELYLESCGEIERPKKPFICFHIYCNIYAKPFEETLRRNLSRRKDTNELFCKIFNIPERYYGMNFDTIRDIEEQKQIIQTAKNWVKNGWRESLLLGSKVTGVGKTNTMACLGHQRYIEFDYTEIKQFGPGMEFLNSSIIFIKERELFNIINLPGMYRGMVIDRLCKVDFLMYDDLFSIARDDEKVSVLMELFDNRLDSAGKATAVTSRFPKYEMETKYPDIYSRLSRGVIYYSNSKKDLRKEKNA